MYSHNLNNPGSALNRKHGTGTSREFTKLENCQPGSATLLRSDYNVSRTTGLSLSLSLGGLGSSQASVDGSITLCTPLSFSTSSKTQSTVDMHGRFQVVDGRRYFDSSSGSWIVFNTPTDALFVHLAQSHGLSYADLDVLLRTLHNPNFNSSQLTLMHATDMDSRISEQRRQDIENISVSAPSGGLDKVGMPLAILKLVVEAMVSELGSFTSDMEAMTFVSCDTSRITSDKLRRALCQMSLVHRSWTPIVQNSINRRTAIPDLDTLRSFVQSATCGPQLRELRVAAQESRAYSRERPYQYGAIYGSDQKSGSSDKRNSPYQDYPTLLAAVFLRAPAMTSLHITLSLSSSTMRDNALVFHAIVHLQSLEHLWLALDTSGASRSVGIHDFRRVCNTISALPRLKLLSLDASSGQEAIDVGLEAFSPPDSLKTLALPRMQSINRQYIDWLVRPRGQYSLQNLAIGMFGSEPDTYCASRIASRLVPCLATIRSLFVEFTPGAYSSGAQAVGPTITALNAEVFQRAGALEHLILCFRYPTTIPLLVIPQTTRSLHIHLRQDADGSLWYGRLPKSLESKTVTLESLYASVRHAKDSSDAFEKVTVTYGKDTDSRRKEAMESTKEAMKARDMLQSRGISLDIHSENYGDLKEMFYSRA